MTVTVREEMLAKRMARNGDAQGLQRRATATVFQPTTNDRGVQLLIKKRALIWLLLQPFFRLCFVQYHCFHQQPAKTAWTLTLSRRKQRLKPPNDHDPTWVRARALLLFVFAFVQSQILLAIWHRLHQQRHQRHLQSAKRPSACEAARMQQRF